MVKDYNDFNVNKLLDLPIEWAYDDHLVLHDPRGLTTRRIFYSILPISRDDYFNRMRSIRMTIMDRKFNYDVSRPLAWFYEKLYQSRQSAFYIFILGCSKSHGQKS